MDYVERKRLDKEPGGKPGNSQEGGGVRTRLRLEGWVDPGQTFLFKRKNV